MITINGAATLLQTSNPIVSHFKHDNRYADKVARQRILKTINDLNYQPNSKV